MTNRKQQNIIGLYHIIFLLCSAAREIVNHHDTADVRYCRLEIKKNNEQEDG